MSTARGTLAARVDLAATLGSGQVFRWREVRGAWVGVVGRAAYRLEARPGGIAVETIGGSVSDLARFLRLDVDLNGLAAGYRDQHPDLADALDRFAGLRVVRQPVDDALLSFACSSANQIGRIARSLDALALHYGTPIGTLAGQQFAALPSWEVLAAADPADLWQRADLGYRGRVIQRLAETIAARPGWLASLADVPYVDAHAELATLPGIGPKIADCVCLYALGHDDAIPVDSHIWAIAHDLFGDAIPTMSLTARTYQRVANLYRAAFSPRPGWAQHYLFHRRRMNAADRRAA